MTKASESYFHENPQEIFAMLAIVVIGVVVLLHYVFFIF